MAVFYTEADYEQSVVELFRDDMDYTYVYGPDIERDYRSPLYEDVLIESIHRINRGAHFDAIKEALYKLHNFENGDLIQKNAVFMDYLQNGIPVVLSSPGNASDHFWELEKRIRQDKKHPGVLIELRKSTAIWDIAYFVRDEVISMEEFDGFSEDFGKRRLCFYSLWG